jgi:hypothetical protein
VTPTTVLREGAMAGELVCADGSEDTVMRLALG